VADGPVKRSVTRVVIEKRAGEPPVRMAILKADGKVVYEEFYYTLDAAVAMLPHIWRDRFSDETKPGV
jgi:hypothetical protein